MELRSLVSNFSGEKFAIEFLTLFCISASRKQAPRCVCVCVGAAPVTESVENLEEFPNQKDKKKKTKWEPKTNRIKVLQNKFQYKRSFFCD